MHVPCNRTQAPARPRPTLGEVQQCVGAVSSALFGLRDLGQETGDHDSQAYRFGAIAGILAGLLDEVWLDIEGLMEGTA